SSAIGATHVAELGGGGELPGPRPTLFFAPAQAAKRQQEWGGAGLNQRLVQAWHAFRARVADPAAPWLRVPRREGSDAALRAYRPIAAGDLAPAIGHVLSLRWGGAAAMRHVRSPPPCRPPRSRCGARCPGPRGRARRRPPAGA